MLSLDNGYSVEDLLSLEKRMKEESTDEFDGFVCELKIDGLSLALIFENGKLVLTKNKENSFNKYYFNF